MLKLTARLMPGTRADIYGRLELPFDRRQKSRLRATLASGEEVALMLPAGAILRGGDLIASADGRIVEVVAVPETLLHVECATPAELTRTAYHLGNRHVPVQVAAGFLRLTQDHVLEEMLRMLGAKVMHIEAPFEPEGGAYSGGSGGHRHHGEARNHGARIHEYK